MTTPGQKPTLEGVVTLYRREVGRAATTPELEVRLLDVDLPNFAAVLEGLAARKGAEPGVSSQVVSAIMDVRSGDHSRSEGPQRHLRPMRIREIHYRQGRREREKFVWKEPLAPPYRVPNATGISYLVALATERPDEQGFSADEGAVIRIKSRMSFRLELAGAAETRPPLDWRIDMTVTRQIMGSDAKASLKKIREAMFPAGVEVTPANFLSVLNLSPSSGAARAAAAQLYRFEIEAEFVTRGETRDMIRPADITAAADAILSLANPEYARDAAAQAEIFWVARFVVQAPGLLRRFQHELGLKSLLPQALAITRADYRKVYPPVGYFLTDKADGQRAVGLVRDGRGAILADRLYGGFAPRGGGPPGGGPPGGGGPDDTVLDGELVSKGGALMFYAFDAIVVGGASVAALPFAKRLARLAEGVAALAAAGVPAAAKRYTHLLDGAPASLRRDFRAVLDAPRDYAVDGLILAADGADYAGTTALKYKPADHNTIDFLARRPPPSVLGKPPFVDRPGHRLYFLFVGINPDMYEALGLRWCPGYAELFGGRADAPANSGNYFPIQFAPSDAPLAFLYHHPDGAAGPGAEPDGDLDGQVVELRCGGDCAAAGGGSPLADWELVRVREDRRRDLASRGYFGNDFHTAELIWLNYLDPFPAEQLWDGVGGDYFAAEKSGAYHALTAVVSYAKTQRIGELMHSGWVVDVGAGKGQDLGRYLDAGVQNLVAVDRDRAALTELIRRKYSHAQKRRGAAGRPREGHGRGRAAATTVHVLLADAAAPHAQTLAALGALGLRREGADALVCNLAAHYFLASVESLRNFVALARAVVRVGGRVVLTVMRGEAIHATLRAAAVPAGGAWDLFEQGTRKYSIKRLYESDRLEDVGQRIGVLLPFSEGEYYEEFLVNTRAVTQAFTERGFSRAAATSLAELLPDFEERNRPVAAALTPGDRQYLALFGELVFVREK